VKKREKLSIQKVISKKVGFFSHLAAFSQYLTYKGCMDNSDLVMLLNSGGLERGRDLEEPGDINFDKLYVHTG
jgi:hypothetical protein